MNDALIYFLKVNIAIALFYLFYRLFFAGDTFWKTRRYYLLFSVFISFAYPLLSIENWLESQETVRAIVVNYAILPEITVTAGQQTSFFNFENVALAVYGLGVFVLFVRLLVQLASILRFGLQGKRQVIQGISVIVLEKEITPFSFFNLVFLNPALHNEHETREILAHELTHVRQGHSLDVMTGELLSILFWFNPATWLLKREIRQNLEFLADDKVIESGFDSKIYQYHLLQLSYQTPEVKLGNKFNVSPLKKRIIMMNQQKTSKARLLKYALIVPLALALVISSNAQTVVNKAKKALSSTKEVVTEKKSEVDQTTKITKTTVKFTAPVMKKDEKTGEKVYDMAEKMPQYQGGESELMKFISQNVKYPIKAQENNVMGVIVVRFIVNKEGRVEQAEIIKATTNKSTNLKELNVVGYGNTTEKTAIEEQNASVKLLEQEALRVVNAMPQWTPGEQNGEKVSVYYILPISFKLEGDSKNKDKEILNIRSANGEKPLYILDGKEITESEFKAIMADNIQSINVLKNESATKVYGDKGKNGVVQITTKK
ncbi:MAG: energy transducer TonB [Paludibacter sp.]|nr:energy transducer TonB [Paludibacter sp.]